MDSFMRERDGERTMRSARDIQRALLDAKIYVTRVTITEDMKAAGTLLGRQLPTSTDATSRPERAS
jgi:hypothetical protein